VSDAAPPTDMLLRWYIVREPEGSVNRLAVVLSRVTALLGTRHVWAFALLGSAG